MILLGIFGLLGGTYYVGREVFYRRLVLSVAQDLFDEIATAKVEKIGAVELGLEGDITLRQVEAYTYRGGVRRLFYRAEKMILSLDGYPGRDRDLRLVRVDLFHPEIFVRRARDGVWNVTWALRSSKKVRREAPERDPPAGAVPRESYPPNGVHIHEGIVHTTIVGRGGKEVTWTATGVRARLSKRDGILRLDPCVGRFYGGRLKAELEIPSTEPFRCHFQVSLVAAEVERLTDGIDLGRPVYGKLDGVLALRKDPSRISPRPIAAGRIKIYNGDLWELPLFLPLLALSPSADRKIDTAQVDFTVEEHQIKIDKMAFIGDPLCLSGSGRMDLDGENLEVIFIPRLGKSGWGDIIPGIGDIFDLVGKAAKRLFTPVVLTGSFLKPRIHVRPFYGSGSTRGK